MKKNRKKPATGYKSAESCLYDWYFKHHREDDVVVLDNPADRPLLEYVGYDGKTKTAFVAGFKINDYYMGIVEFLLENPDEKYQYWWSPTGQENPEEERYDEMIRKLLKRVKHKNHTI